MSARPASLLINTFNVVRQDVPSHPTDVNNQSACRLKHKKYFLPSSSSRKRVASCNLQNVKNGATEGRLMMQMVQMVTRRSRLMVQMVQMVTRQSRNSEKSSFGAIFW